ncbi:recombinase family protein [Bacillus mycoides]|uniref:recombinase family protein n=1 Tax=Bacillus mycoides TaxID=1405 RepID=UPI001C022F15|nr:recombinase family protein [Bacillus mycoides]QWG56867.1 recombinase family protein [Bacillus mycoides]QWG75355.1 recombinase family protein [Bacillus mycoides]QWH23875.1 recombinase family protein [Bacillus mycoides]
MDNRKFGYIRVSSRDQNEARQLQSMKEVGISDRDIFIDKQSGKDFNREKYQSIKHHLRAGDILYIHSLDRFGRNKEEILNEWTDITKNIKADIVVLDMPLLDTTKYQDSLGTFISDLVLQILSWLAEEERERIKKRQKEGIEVALKNGVQFGRPKAEITDIFKDVYSQWKAGRITATEAMKRADMKRTTFYKLVREYEEQQNE